MRASFIVLLFILFATKCFGVDFNKLSRTEPVTTVYQADSKCYVDALMNLDLRESEISNVFLRIQYIIGNDTLNDNLWVDVNYSGVVKRLFLDEGERLTAKVFLNNSEDMEFENVKGSFSVIRNLTLNPASDQGKNTFVGSVWKSDQTPLFRINKKDSTGKVVRLKFSLNQNFEFDKLMFKVKVISPADGIVMISRDIDVNEGEYLNMSRKVFTIAMDEINMSKPGSYYLQVIQNTAYSRLNGIEGVDYDVIEQ